MSERPGLFAVLRSMKWILPPGPTATHIDSNCRSLGFKALVGVMNAVIIAEGTSVERGLEIRSMLA